MSASGLGAVMRNLKKKYSKHLLEKANTMQSLLAELDCVCPCQSIEPSPVENGYRNRAKFKIFGREEQTETKGTDPARGEVLLEESLWILPEWGRALVRGVDGYLRENSFGCHVDGFEVNLTHGREEGHLTLSVKPESGGNYDKLAQEMVKRINGLTGVAIPSQKKEYGEPFLCHSLLDLVILAHYSAFFQSNLHLTPRLVETVCSFFEGIRFSRIYDLYCGAGLYSLFLEKYADELLGVDNSGWSVKSARMNADRLGLRHAHFFCASVESFIEKNMENRSVGDKEIVLLNPLRSGVPAQVINAVASRQVENVCLVSCCLETHLRDLSLWGKAGYVIISMTAFDMFPFTDFLETATLLRRDK
jgi:tRNA/tmRNA/rRNA uracil-C5-methylase (TrmA/RlmC/RlmD family)